MDYVLLSLGIVLVILGLLGCVLPVIPGPPLSFAALLLVHFTSFGNISTNVLIVTGIAAAVVTILDYVFPVWATKKFGGSKRGVWGATIGLVVGLFLFPPFGIIFGPFVGALVGELTAGQTHNQAIRSAFGSFVGFLLGTGLKFAVSGLISYYFVMEAFVR